MPISKEEKAAREEKVAEKILKGVSNSSLPPSVEAAYYKKCIELKRRLNEIEANNDKMRLAISRHNRAIKKMRLERAILLDGLMRQSSSKDAEESESERSESPPPSPIEKTSRTKRRSKHPASSPAPADLAADEDRDVAMDSSPPPAPQADRPRTSNGSTAAGNASASKSRNHFVEYVPRNEASSAADREESTAAARRRSAHGGRKSVTNGVAREEMDVKSEDVSMTEDV